jgi:hypothetical protein
MLKKNIYSGTCSIEVAVALLLCIASSLVGWRVYKQASERNGTEEEEVGKRHVARGPHQRRRVAALWAHAVGITGHLILV